MNMNDPEHKWVKVRINQPSARHQHTIAGFREDSPKHKEQKAYIFGGISMPDNILFNDFWEIDHSNLEVKQTNNDGSNKDELDNCVAKKIPCTGSVPSPRKGHTALCYNNHMYVFGGQTDNNQDNTTDNIHILSLGTYNWSLFDTKSSHISPRSQMSSAWLNPDVVFLFGGVENSTNNGINDILCLQMNDMHISFPFTAGEYPGPRYGHAACNYISASGEENMLILGGINNEFCTMDIYTLLKLERNLSQKWEKIIEKDEFEEMATKEAAKFVYSARKHCLTLHDIIVEEKSKGIDIRKNELEIQQEL